MRQQVREKRRLCIREMRMQERPLWKPASSVLSG